MIKTWAKPSKRAQLVGVTSEFVKFTGPVANFIPRSINIVLDKGDSIGNLETSRGIFTIPSPIAGRISNINSILAVIPDRITNMADQEWLIEVSPT